MSQKILLSLISLMPSWIGLLLIKLNKYPFLVFGKNYRKIFLGFDGRDESKFLVFFNLAVQGSVFYKRLYGVECGANINTIEDFKKLCFIDKDVVLDNFDDIVVDSSSASLCTTGGTSGKPLKLFLPKSRYANEFGALHALWSKIEYDFSVRAVVRNERIVGRDFIINPITKEFIFDGFRTDKEYLAVIYNVMKKHNIAFFHGYTSNAERFVSFILDNNLEYGFLKGLITSSENLYAHQRYLFERLVGVHHMNFFGHTEKLLLGGWCEKGECYHFYNSYGYAELVDDAGCDVINSGEVGELVGSTNYNVNMPLFRYRTGDFAEKAPDNCPACGFQGLSVYKILGRWRGERIYNKDNTFVTTTSLNLHSDIYDHIDSLQYFQSEKGMLEVRVVPSQTYSHEIEALLQDTVKRKFKPDTQVSISRVDEIERKENGKYLLLISQVK